ncbi:hypothetical protein JAAARDRAFT_35943, partial [Jaapia argillacea MUCL 33604]
MFISPSFLPSTSLGTHPLSLFALSSPLHFPLLCSPYLFLTHSFTTPFSHIPSHPHPPFPLPLSSSVLPSLPLLFSTLPITPSSSIPSLSSSPQASSFPPSPQASSSPSSCFLSLTPSFLPPHPLLLSSLLLTPFLLSSLLPFPSPDIPLSPFLPHSLSHTSPCIL